MASSTHIGEQPIDHSRRVGDIDTSEPHALLPAGGAREHADVGPAQVELFRHELDHRIVGPVAGGGAATRSFSASP